MAYEFALARFQWKAVMNLLWYRSSGRLLSTSSGSDSVESYHELAQVQWKTCKLASQEKMCTFSYDYELQGGIQKI
jgi:hypothetical protein